MGTLQKISQGNGLSHWSFSDGTHQIRCEDCNAWIHAQEVGQQTIRHSKRCDAQNLQPQEPGNMDINKNVSRRSGNGLSGDQLLAAVQRGALTQNEAMNTDF